ncbi:hypothetical protein [Coleofasciculus sp.]|uniref:hypothetical protein n=1 Tax=Coleofasciculus sp. TaxID=3100458 RepID=UPI0039FAD96E
MSYCKNFSRAIVEYEFKGEENSQIRRFETEKTPFEVTTGSIPVFASDNYDPSGFEIYFYSPNNYGWIRSRVIDFIIYESTTKTWDGLPYAGIARLGCGKTDYQRASDGTITGTGIRPSTLEIDKSIKCPQAMGNTCHIKIFYKGEVIHQDQGKCPLSYNVDCDPCPPNTIKCVENEKVKCVPCSTFLEPLKGMVNTIKGINNG